MIMQPSETASLRGELRRMLGIPAPGADLNPELRGRIETDDIQIEKWIWTSEPGSRITSLLYLPKHRSGRVPGIVVTNGHGGSKNSSYAQYTGQLYAKLGMACLLHDTIGEEERHFTGEMGTRAHDIPAYAERAEAAGRPIMGKMVLDAMRAVDFLASRQELDAERLGVVGNSLGGTVATWMIALEPRLKAAIVSGSGFCALNSVVCKPCCADPFRRMQDICDDTALVSLAAPHCAVLSMNGDIDEIVTHGHEDYWTQHLGHTRQIAQVYESYGAPDKFKVWFQPDGGHRAYPLHKDALEWLAQHLQLSDWPPGRIQRLPTVTLEQWFGLHSLEWPERGRGLYWVDRHHKGAVYADMGIHPLPERQLRCLRSDEVGRTEYTLEGWLALIEHSRQGGTAT